MFIIFINDLDDSVECTLSKFADNTKIGGVAYTPKMCASFQKYLNKLEEWTNRIFLKFNKNC